MQTLEKLALKTGGINIPYMSPVTLFAGIQLNFEIPAMALSAKEALRYWDANFRLAVNEKAVKLAKKAPIDSAMAVQVAREFFQKRCAAVYLPVITSIDRFPAEKLYKGLDTDLDENTVWRIFDYTLRYMGVNRNTIAGDLSPLSQYRSRGVVRERLVTQIFEGYLSEDTLVKSHMNELVFDVINQHIGGVIDYLDVMANPVNLKSSGNHDVLLDVIGWLLNDEMADYRLRLVNAFYDEEIHVIEPIDPVVERLYSIEDVSFESFDDYINEQFMIADSINDEVSAVLMKGATRSDIRVLNDKYPESELLASFDLESFPVFEHEAVASTEGIKEVGKAVSKALKKALGFIAKIIKSLLRRLGMKFDESASFEVPPGATSDKSASDIPADQGTDISDIKASTEVLELWRKNFNKQAHRMIEANVSILRSPSTYNEISGRLMRAIHILSSSVDIGLNDMRANMVDMDANVAKEQLHKLTESFKDTQSVISEIYNEGNFFAEWVEKSELGEVVDREEHPIYHLLKQAEMKVKETSSAVSKKGEITLAGIKNIGTYPDIAKVMDAGDKSLEDLDKAKRILQALQSNYQPLPVVTRSAAMPIGVDSYQQDIQVFNVYMADSVRLIAGATKTLVAYTSAYDRVARSYVKQRAQYDELKKSKFF